MVLGSSRGLSAVGWKLLLNPYHFNFFFNPVWGFFTLLVEKTSFRNNLMVEKSFRISDSVIHVKWLTGKVTVFLRHTDGVSCQLLRSREYLWTGCFHSAMADRCLLTGLLFFFADWLKNYRCLPCQRWCLETISWEYSMNVVLELSSMQPML